MKSENGNVLTLTEHFRVRSITNLSPAAALRQRFTTGRWPRLGSRLAPDRNRPATIKQRAGGSLLVVLRAGWWKARLFGALARAGFREKLKPKIATINAGGSLDKADERGSQRRHALRLAVPVDLADELARLQSASPPFQPSLRMPHRRSFQVRRSRQVDKLSVRRVWPPLRGLLMFRLPC
ncbi:MAG: hypothetical protein HPM95_15095 [Alphaproteobacteria bacterium]|nr:hypothetical protein [Alphaproteobacteria bacterium]